MAGVEPKITSGGGKGEFMRVGWVRWEGFPLTSNECGVVIALYICTYNANASAPSSLCVREARKISFQASAALDKSEGVKTYHSGSHLPPGRGVVPASVTQTLS